jgi:ankyrin repeat protein
VNQEVKDIDRALLTACQNFDSANVEYLLAEGADPNCFDPKDYWRTPLRSVVYHYSDHPSLHDGEYALVRALVIAGAAIKTELVPYDRGIDSEPVWTTSLHTAAERGQIELLCMLVESPGGSEALAYFTAMDQTPLAVAAKAGNAAAVQYLLEEGSDPNLHAPYCFAEGWCHDLPLHDAVCSGDIETVFKLLDAGADPLGYGWMGVTPLDRADDSGDSRIIRLVESYVRPQSLLAERAAKRRLRRPERSDP